MHFDIQKTEKITRKTIRMPFLVIGDCVKLKMGGPEMTVKWVGNDCEDWESADCQWVDENGQYQTKKFPLKALEKTKCD